MSKEPVWYYAEGDKQKGPVSEKDLRQLAKLGRIKPTDLVWRKGMEDWVAGKTIEGLFPIPVPGNEESSDVPDFDANIVTTERKLNRGRRGIRLDASLIDSFGLKYGKVLILIGFALLLFGRGCDSVGSRYAQRQRVLYDLAQNKLSAKYERKRAKVQSKINSLRMESSPSDEQEIRDLNADLTKVNSDMVEEKGKLETGKWLNLRIAANSAASKHQAFGVFYEFFFVVGTFILLLGLIGIAFAGEGPEKIVCWILLAIIGFSIFVVGTPWISALGIPGM